MGAIERNIVAQAKRFNDPIPDRIKNKPRLNRALAFYMDAFVELDTDRPVAFSFGVIPWSVIHTYAKAHELEGDDYHEFVYLIRTLDMAYVKHVQGKKDNG